MGDTVEFKNSFFRDGAHPQTLEDAIRIACAYAGVHDFDFQDLIDEDGSSVTNWLLSSGSHNVSNVSYIEFTGAGSGLSVDLNTTEGRLSSLISMDLVSGQGGILFKGVGSDRRGFIMWFNSSSCGVSYSAADGSETVVKQMPYGVAAPARIQVLARYSLDSADEERKWIEAGMYVDGMLYVGFAMDVSGTDQDWDGDYVGVAVRDTDTLCFKRFTVSMMDRVVEWIVVDPGQPPGSGMGRAIGTTRVSYMCRYDNTVRVWRPGNKELDLDISKSNAMKLDEKRLSSYPNHARVQAAIHESDGFDDQALSDMMHRFILHNDPNIMSDKEAYAEAFRVIHDEQEKALTCNIALAPSYVIEPHDRITLDGNDYRVITISLSIQMTAQGPQIQQVLGCQRYVEQ